MIQNKAPFGELMPVTRWLIYTLKTVSSSRKKFAEFLLYHMLKIQNSNSGFCLLSWYLLLCIIQMLYSSIKSYSPVANVRSIMDAQLFYWLFGEVRNYRTIFKSLNTSAEIGIETKNVIWQ